MVDRLERITNLLTLLLETRAPVTLRQIVHELEGYPPGPEAVRGAFERDKAVLREIGIPIDTVVLGGDQAGETGYMIDRARYELRDLVLDDDERQALQTAVATVRSDVGQEGVWKLGGSVLPTSSVLAQVPELPGLPALRGAVRDHATVSFAYRSVDRRLDPFGLLLRDGAWYVIGHDHAAAEVRTYRVDRIEGAVGVGEAGTFERPVGFDARAAFPADPKVGFEVAPGDEPQHALVDVDATVATVVTAELGEDAAVERRPDGSALVRVPCANAEAFRSWLLGLGAHAEVVAPADVRAGVVEWLTAVAGSAR